MYFFVRLKKKTLLQLAKSCLHGDAFGHHVAAGLPTELQAAGRKSSEVNALGLVHYFLDALVNTVQDACATPGPNLLSSQLLKVT